MKGHCSVEGCGNTSRNASGRLLCEAHYMRLRRKGTTDLKVPKPRLTHSHGYTILRCPNHPLASRRGSNHEYEHRVVFYDAHGEGPFDCHWCGQEVDWSNLHVDHLDDVKDHNDLINLVASCPTCNQARGAEKMRLTQRQIGKSITHIVTDQPAVRRALIVVALIPVLCAQCWTFMVRPS